MLMMQAAQPHLGPCRLGVERWEVRSVAVWARPPISSAGVEDQTPAPIGSRRDRRRPSSQELRLVLLRGLEAPLGLTSGSSTNGLIEGALVLGRGPSLGGAAAVAGGDL